MHVRYKLVAQEEVIEHLRMDRNRIMGDKPDTFLEAIARQKEPTLLQHLTDFLCQIEKCDRRVQLFQRATR